MAVPSTISGKTAIAGIGYTEFSKNSGTTVLNLAARASLKAIEDAGLRPADIDGMASFFWGPAPNAPPQQLMAALGIGKCNLEIFSPFGGNWACGAVAMAALAVHAGLCKNVLVYRAMNGRSERSHDWRVASGPAQFVVPYGPFGSGYGAVSYGHHATAHMARFGTTTEDFAHVAVAQRQHAALNTKAMMRKPISVADHQNSKWIAYPFRMLDCCLETDGAVAVIVTSTERAKDLRHGGVEIAAMSAGMAPGPNLWETNGVRAAPDLYGAAGIAPKDIDVAELYDPFTFMCMTHMEDFGLVEKGAIGAWVRDGNHTLDGRVPVNTHGGLLSEGYVQGLNHILEAVQQLRPGGVCDDLCPPGAHTFDRSICRQVRDPVHALVCSESGASSLILRRSQG